MSTAAATSGIRNYGACFCTWKDTILENFTNSVAGTASLILDARFHYWVEENHFDGLEIRNCYYGVCFTSEDDQNGIAASCMNNVFTDTHIWVTRANGKGLYGVGLGATGVVQLARTVFISSVIHPSAAGVICYELSACYCEGTVFVSPSVDVFGNPGTITGFNYTFSDALVLLSPTFFPVANVATPFTGNGAYVISGGNGASPTANTYYRIEGIISAGNDSVYAANNLSAGLITIRDPAEIHGVTIYNGSVVSGDIIVALYDSTGTLVASSTSHAQSGTYTMQPIPFSSACTAKPGTYYVGVIASSATARFALVCGSVPTGGASLGSFAAPSTMTPPGTIGGYIISASTY